MDFTEFVGKAVFALWAKPKGNRCKSQYVGQGVVWRRSVLADCFSIYYCGNCKVWNLNIKCGPSSRVFSSCTTGNWPSLPTLRRLCPLTLPPAAPAGISADKKREMKWNWAPPLLEEMNRVWIGEQTQQNIWNNSTMYKKKTFFCLLSCPGECWDVAEDAVVIWSWATLKILLCGRSQRVFGLVNFKLLVFLFCELMTSIFSKSMAHFCTKTAFFASLC